MNTNIGVIYRKQINKTLYHLIDNEFNVNNEKTNKWFDYLKDDFDVITVPFGLLVSTEFGSVVQKRLSDSQLSVCWQECEQIEH
jgi:hypothetical protein